MDPAVDKIIHDLIDTTRFAVDLSRDDLRKILDWMHEWNQKQTDPDDLFDFNVEDLKIALYVLIMKGIEHSGNSN